MSILFFEFRFALIRLWRRRMQSGLMLATFTISIALSLLGWSLFHTMFLRNPEFDPHGEFYRVGQTGDMVNGRIISVSREDLLAWKEQQSVFTDVIPVRLYDSIFVETNSGVERLLSASLSTDALRLVNAKPLMGRLFTPDEDKIGCAPVIILSERTWQNKFAGDPNIIGRLIKVDSVPTIVVGVMPVAFRFPNEQEMWQPLGYSVNKPSLDQPELDLIVRLKPGITMARAADDLNQITERRGPDTLYAKFKLRAVVTPFREYYLLEDMHQSSLALFALALLFVIVGCANAANLVMIDFFGRTGEIASTLALGIPRSSSIRVLCMQLLMLAGFAAAIGCFILYSAGPAVHSAMARITTPYWLLFTPQWHQIGMAALLAILSAGIALIAPLGFLLFANPEEIIRSSAGSSRGTGRSPWRRALMVAQIALLTVLAISAGLLFRSSLHLGRDHWGFDGTKIFASKTAMKSTDFPTPESRLTAHLKLVDEIERIPGVAASGLMTNPVGFSGEASTFYAKAAEGLAEGHYEGAVTWSLVTPNIFTVFDLPFSEGETFSRDAKMDDPYYVVINQSLAFRLWPGQSALGRSLYLRSKDPKQKPNMVIVRGVVRDFQASGPMARNNDFVFMSFRGGMAQASFLYARGFQAPPSNEAIMGAARLVDPRIAIYFSTSVQKVIDIQLSSVHLTTRLTFVYAIAALLLCAVGVYSITVSQILQRSREFGIRMALGIDAKSLWQRFTIGYLITAFIGVTLGIAATFAVVRVLQALLFGVSSRDPLTFIIAIVLILSVSALACIPSLFRLKRINPADCLRSL